MTKSIFTLRPAAPGLLVALLAGCSLVPTYERPAPPVPQKFADVADQKAQALPDWQTYYTDPALRQLIEAALQNNRDLRIALARVAEARGQAGVADADRFPALNAQASSTQSRTPSEVLGFSQARTITRRKEIALSVPAFELDFWGRVAALNDAARAQYLASQEAANSFRIGLIGDVAATWFQFTELSQRERIARGTLENRGTTLELVRKRRDVGLATDLDVLAAESLTETVRAQLADLQRQRRQTEGALQLLTGYATPLPKPDTSDQAPTLPQLAPGLPSEVLLRRPDVRAAEQRLIAANANIGAARAAFFPTISLTGNLGTASRQFSGLFDKGSQTWLFQPVISIPLFNAGKAQANLDVAKARKQGAVADYEKTIQQAFHEVADALAAREQYREQLDADEANLRAQRTRLERVQAREQAGIASYLEVLDASRDAFTAEQTAMLTRRQVLAADAALYKALGGGDAGEN